jgi:hypothetical protein
MSDALPELAAPLEAQILSVVAHGGQVITPSRVSSGSSARRRESSAARAVVDGAAGSGSAEVMRYLARLVEVSEWASRNQAARALELPDPLGELLRLDYMFEAQWVIRRS